MCEATWGAGRVSPDLPCALIVHVMWGSPWPYVWASRSHTTVRMQRALERTWFVLMLLRGAWCPSGLKGVPVP